MASVALSALRAETAVREKSDWPSSSDDDEGAFVELSPQQNLYRSTMAHFTPRQIGGRFGGKISASLETFLSSFFADTYKNNTRIASDCCKWCRTTRPKTNSAHIQLETRCKTRPIPTRPNLSFKK